MTNNSNEQDSRAMVADKGDYKVIVRYSDEAIAKKLIKFETKSGDSFEVPVEQMIELVSHYVNGEDLAPMLVDTERIKVVYVKRHIIGTLTEDKKKGENISFQYSHPYPLEFAIIEEGFKIAEIQTDREGFIVTPELLKQVKRETPLASENFVRKFYKAFKNIVLGGST